VLNACDSTSRINSGVGILLLEQRIGFGRDDLVFGVRFSGGSKKIFLSLKRPDPQGKRKRGRSKKTWKRTVEEEARGQGKRWQEVKALAKNKVSWRSFVKALCCAPSKSKRR
jgi:hypothetical protein